LHGSKQTIADLTDENNLKKCANKTAAGPLFIAGRPRGSTKPEQSDELFLYFVFVDILFRIGFI
jgi:hypothetical protein